MSTEHAAGGGPEQAGGGGIRRLLRQGASLLLPVTMAGIVPVLIADSAGTVLGWPASALHWAALLAGLAALSAGAVLFFTSVRLFATFGRGTLAPWDPPVRLVASGPYAHVRNPMISGVLLVLLAEALILRSLPHLTWFAAFFLINAVYIPLVEEPALRTRFGAEWERYAAGVPRLVPRMTPWRPS